MRAARLLPAASRARTLRGVGDRQAAARLARHARLRSRAMTTARHRGGKLIVITGMSGAGRSTALKTFEDMGYEAVDNLPLWLLPHLVGFTPAHLRLALGVDVRTRDFAVPALVAALARLVAEQDLDLRVVFLDC